MPNSPQKQEELDSRRAKVLALINEAGLTQALTAEILGLKCVANDVKALRKQGQVISVQKVIDYTRALSFSAKKARSILMQDEAERLEEALELPQIQRELFALEQFAQQMARPASSDETHVGVFFLALYGGLYIDFNAWASVMDEIEEGQARFQNADTLRHELKERTILKARAHVTFGRGDELADYVSAWVSEHLAPRQTKVILMRFGLPPYTERYGLEDVGREFGVTRERIRQVEMQALRQLRHPKRRWQIDPFALGTNHVSMEGGQAYLDLRVQRDKAIEALEDHPVIRLVSAVAYPEIAMVEDDIMSPAEAVSVWLATRSGELKAVRQDALEFWHETSADSGRVVSALCTTIDDLELSVRSANVLQNKKCRYVAELVTETEASLRNTGNFGRKGLNELKEVLGELESIYSLPTGSLILGQRIDHPHVRMARARLGLPSVE